MLYRRVALGAWLCVFFGGCDCGGDDPMDGDAGVGEDMQVPTADMERPADMNVDAFVGPMCGDLRCGPGERCEEDPDPVCVPNTCDDLSCSATERCEPSPDGSGNVCVDISCAATIDCPEAEHCADGVCTADVCEPGVRSCGAAGVEECAPDGSGTEVPFMCGSDAYYTSECTDDGGAFCPCRDDWDCPADTRCEAGVCEGTGRAPTCLLPPAPFTEVLPSMEPGFPWGGTGIGSEDAVGSPFPQSSQVVMTPLVANLDDDNGDGLIDERDIPEIVFMTFCDSAYTTNGVLRAVHGGGPNRGADFFATCGSTDWHEGDDPSVSCSCSAAQLDPTSTPAVGDIDGDGVPEIVAITENSTVQLFSNTGAVLAESAQSVGGNNPAISIVNLDGEGFAELVIGDDVLTFVRDSTGNVIFGDIFRGNLGDGRNSQGPISCVADLDGDGRQDIVGGSTAYRYPAKPAGAVLRSDCTGGETGDEEAWCDGELVVMWDGQTVNGAAAQRNGFCAVADVWGAAAGTPPGPANPLDGVPEVILVATDHIQIFDVTSGVLIEDRSAPGRGGAPNVDDFDGDGFPEIGAAFGDRYQLVDLQPPTAACPAWPNVFVDELTGLQGNVARTAPSATCATDADCGDMNQFACNPQLSQCVCLHNGWERRTEDDSSRVTGSSVFDFNGDGAAEVVYNDECWFRVYAGIDGLVYFKEQSPSRTRTENPIVADVDNDGNAEIVFGASNESGFCSQGNDFNNGIEVWGDASDAWVGARRIYNQHAYHVTNVTESGGVPTREPESWRTWNGRLYNSYRSQPRSFGVAPDLQVGGVQVTSPGATCGDALTGVVDITARIVNAGDLRVGGDIQVTFYGEWDAGPVNEPLYADAAMTPLSTTLGRPLEPGGELFLTVTYDPAFNGPGTLPDRIRVVVDEAAAERECIEDNNELTHDLSAGEGLADLVVELGAVGGRCPSKTFETTMTNNGSVAASDVVVRYYAGDPASGGEVIHEETVTGPIGPGESVTFTATTSSFPPRSVVVYAVVDPDDAIAECNDGNNTAMGERVECLLL